ncbi:MAG TPA: glycoside hydrolase family 3 N-terminal domain-containing protein [Bacteroidota bacterium]|nr:glycoside hydrolase family 3 N-terminal domain-containing protein [Bacteroidota bacterium]
MIAGCAGEKTTRPSRDVSSAAEVRRDTASVKPAPVPLTWIDSTIQRMTLEEKAAQMVCVFTFTHYYANDDGRWKDLERLVVKRKIGGFVFSEGSLYAFPVYANRLQKVSDIPLLISVDFERGSGMRVDEGTMMPREMAIGATRDTRLAYEVGMATAREGRALGAHQNYAPVADVNTNPKNPIINTRSFGSDAALVADMTAAFVRGTQDGGMIATVKHFPGHGATEVDTHLGGANVETPREQLEKNDLLPFKAAIEAGVLSVMTGHLSTPAFDKSNNPASVSTVVTTDLLRTTLGFKGLVVTDAMNMRAVSRKYSNDEAAVMAVKAGNDVVLMPPDADGAIDAIVSAVRRGDITESRIDQSVRRILKAKQWAGLDTNRFINIDKIGDAVGIAGHQALAQEVARKSVTVLGNKSHLLPFSVPRKKHILDIAFAEKENPAEGRAFHRGLRHYHRATEYVKIDPRSNEMEYARMLEKAKQADVLVLHFYIEAHSRPNYLPDKILAAVRKLLALNKPLVAVSFGNPYIVLDFPSVENYVCTYGPGDQSIEAAADVLFGDQPALGKLPVAIPGLYEFGDGVLYGIQAGLRVGEPDEAGFNDTFPSSVDSVVNAGIERHAYPGAVLLVAKDGIIVHDKAYGRYTYDADAPAVTPETIFDLASLTKVISTTTAVMRLVDEKKIDLDLPVAAYIPAFGQRGKEKLTIRNLLLHNSGLPGWKKFYTICADPKCVMDSLYATPLEYPTGTQTVYSDLGFITLGKVIEKVTGITLDRFVDSVFFKPLAMNSTMYLPSVSLKGRIAPTEIDSFWHKTFKPVQGRVHDENAATLGGVSGNAGLFSTAGDLVRLLQMELNGGIFSGVRYIKRETIKEFTHRASDLSTRCLGWDSKSLAGNAWAGRLVSGEAYLHTGFTGTSVVVDPARNLIIVFLTNRVYPTRENNGLARVRPVLHDAIIGAIDDSDDTEE